MKACKIILIVLLGIKTLVQILKTIYSIAVDDDDSLQQLITLVVGIPITWLLYWGAGILNLSE